MSPVQKPSEWLWRETGERVHIMEYDQTTDSNSQDHADRTEFDGGFRAARLGPVVQLLWRACLAAALVLTATACSSDAEPDGSGSLPGSDGTPKADYSIKVWVLHDGKRNLVEFAPADAPDRGLFAARTSTPEHSETTVQPFGLQPRGNATIEDPDGGIVHEGDMADEELAQGKQPGWGFLRAALEQCAYEVADWTGMGPTLAEFPWTGGHWYFFTEGEYGGVAHCDYNLRYQELLVCAAAKLTEVSETVGNITWDNVTMGSTLGFEYQKPVRWVIPAQSTRDKFVLHDLAINALAHVALLNNPLTWKASRPSYFPDDMSVATCADFFAWAMSAPSEVTYFEEVYEPKSPEDPAFAANRLRLQANILRAAGRLLRDLVDRSFYADLAGAEKNRARVGDPARGTGLMWGVQSGEDGSYNTLRHAMRLLFGRWELGPNYAVATQKVVDDPCQCFGGECTCPVPDCLCLDKECTCEECSCTEAGACSCTYEAPLAPPPDVTGKPRVPHEDPACRGYRALELLRKESTGTTLLSPGFSARWQDREVSTTGQSLAYSTLLGAGIVIPPASYRDKDVDPVRTAIEEQLLLEAANAARANGEPWIAVGSEAFDTFKNSVAGKAVSAVFHEIEDEDLVFALDRMFGQFRLLTDQRESLNRVSGVLGAKLRTAPHVAPSLVNAPVNGGALEGGFPAHDLIAEPAAKLAGARLGSQCRPFASGSGGTSTWWGDAANDVYASFQNVFLLGDTLRSQLEQMAEMAASPTDVVDLASLGSAELRTWTGPGRMIVRWEADNTVRIRLLGIEPGDIGADSARARDMEDRLVVVYGEAWRADCVAGLRDSCEGARLPPGHGEAVRQWAKSLDRIGFASDPASQPGYSETRGHYGRVYDWVFQWPERQALGFRGTLYVVVPPSNKGPEPTGRVLGSFYADCRLGTCSKLHATDTLSTYQRDLATKAFQVGARWPEYGNELGEDSTGLPGAYCMKGVSRNFFVSLENELTSDNDQFEDSWKHYLDMAEAASARADSLAQDLISVGTETDVRREAAGFELAQVCGDFSAVGGLKASDGRVELPQDDGHLKSCLEPEASDLVFVTTDPYPDEQDKIAKIRDEILLCGDALKAHPLCAKDAGSLSYATLNLVPMPVAGESTEWPGCGEIESVAADGKFQEPHLRGDRLAAYMSPSRLIALLGALQLQMEVSGNWRLMLLDRILMSSHDSETNDNGDLYYPRCACGGQAQCDTQSCSAEAKRWAAIFQTIPAPPGNDTGLQMYEVGLMVQRALWGLGARAGALPRGTIAMPLPVLNVADPLWADPDRRTMPIPAPLVYGASRFESDLSGKYVLALGVIPGTAGRRSYDEDRTQLGPVPALPATTAAWGARARVGTPDWLRDTYADAAAVMGGSQAAAYLAVTTGNSEIRFNEVDHEKWLRTILSGCDGVALAESGKKTVPTADLRESLVIEGPACQTMQVLPRQGNKFGPIVYGTGGIGFFFQLGVGNGGMPEGFFAGHVAAMSVSPAEVVPRHVPAPTDLHEGLLTQASGFDAYESGGQYTYFPSCSNPLGGPLEWNNHAQISIECLRDDISFPQWSGNTVGYRLVAPGTFSLPQVCPPEDRVQLFLSHGAGDAPMIEQEEATDCAVPTEMVVQTMGLACLATEKLQLALDAPFPPPIRSETDIALFQAWLQNQNRQIKSAAAAQIFESIPEAVVLNMKPGATGAVEATGRQGQLHYELQRQIEQLNQAWQSSQSQFSKLSSLLDLLRADIRLATISGRRELISNELGALSFETQGLALEAELIELDRQASLQSVRSMQRSFALISGTASNAARLGVSQGADVGAYSGLLDTLSGWYLGKQEDEITAQSRERSRENIAARRDNVAKAMGLQSEDAQLIAEQTATTVQRAFAEYAVASVPIYEQLDGAVSQINLSANEIRSTLLELSVLRNNASYYAAGAAGADYFTDENGEVVKLPVNTVLRRQYDVTRLRYEQALEDAKRLSYMARLAIEQRIGMRLDQIDEPVGSLEAPRLWADKVCSLQGVDYEKLRSYEQGTTSQAELETISQFADQYVGDYVAKLRSFMGFYSAAYPFHEGDDLTVLSVRDDLMQPDGVCLRDGRNMLLYSDQLWRRGQEGSGWVHRSCEADSLKCVIASPPEALASAQALQWEAPEPPGGFGGVTWLRDVERDPSEPVPGSALVSEPDGFVYQSVYLTAKTPYVVSWWDMWRGPSGGPPYLDGAHSQPGSDDRYLATVYGTNWEVLAQTMVKPAASFEGDDSGLGSQRWSPRRELAFTVPADAWYRVAFRPSLRGGPNGSVAIANVQLEEEAVGTIGPGPYVATLATRETLSGKCDHGRAEDFRKGFDHRCDVDGSCFYELRHPFIVDTRGVNALTSRLVGKLAAGNYNFRHVDLAANVVGTGVIDCADQGGSCYSDAYLEYTIEHDAFRIPLEDYSGAFHGFNFGSAAIRRGKALAAERWITNPIGPADLGLLKQPQFTKIELRGRPLSGTYRLRVYDRPGLDWERVEDIQLVLTYRYWSRIREGTSN